MQAYVLHFISVHGWIVTQKIALYMRKGRVYRGTTFINMKDFIYLILFCNVNDSGMTYLLALYVCSGIQLRSYLLYPLP